MYQDWVNAATVRLSGHTAACTVAGLVYFIMTGNMYCRGVSSHRLVPGDVVVLLRGKATCDMVLLQGSCLVEESILSGEVPPPLAVHF